jgi:hypothetical protein
MSKDNGKPRFNFRLMSYADEQNAQMLAIRIQQLGKQIDACEVDTDIEPLIEKYQALSTQSLQLSLGVVEYLPERYLKQGIKPDDVDYTSIDSLMQCVASGMMDKLALDIQDARRNLVKNS